MSETSKVVDPPLENLDFYAPEEITILWVQALESGKYNQGKHRLKWDHRAGDSAKVSYCCLGVLCDVIDDTKWEYIELDGCDKYNNAVISELPDSVVQKMGLNTTGAFTVTRELLRTAADFGLSDRAIVELQAALLNENDDATISLATLNDTGATFKDIASILKAGPDWN